VVLEFLAGSGIPDFYRLSHLEEVIYMCQWGEAVDSRW
jgi:hypothetical protein